jgi:ABC-type multidrug transport system fused ATPase/permease subunit
MKDGRIVEAGRFTELVALNGLFAKLVEQQSLAATS